MIQYKIYSLIESNYIPSRGQLGSFLWMINKSMYSNPKFRNDWFTDSMISLRDKHPNSVLQLYSVEFVLVFKCVFSKYRCIYSFFYYKLELPMPINSGGNDVRPSVPSFLSDNSSNFLFGSVCTTRVTNVKVVYAWNSIHDILYNHTEHV